MQEVNISFQGINISTPADLVQDGQLEACVGLEMKNGALRPSVLQGTEYTFTPPVDVELKVLHRHTTNSYDNFIFQGSDNHLYWAKEQANMSPAPVSDETINASSVRSIGNVLVAQTSEGPFYHIFREGSYAYIGQKPPEINMSFGLYGQEMAYYDPEKTEQKFQVNTWNGNYNIIEPIRAYDVAFGAVNKLMEEHKEAMFYPFFIRAAYRYVDGTHTMFTSPVLMIPDTRGPRAFLSESVIETINDNGVVTVTVKGKAAAHAIGTNIIFRIFSAEGLDEWKEIIAGVDVFITVPTNPIDTGKMVELLKDPLQMPASWGQHGGAGQYMEQSFPYELTAVYFALPQKDASTYVEDLLGASQFYRVKSWTLDAYKDAVSDFAQRLELDIPIQDLAFSETLNETEDYRIHDTVVAVNSFVYNSRMHIFGLSRKPFAGYRPENMWPYLNNGNNSYTLDVHLKQRDGQSVIVRQESSVTWLSPVSRFYYYPDASATRMVVYDNSSKPVLDIPLKPHPFLNGAYYLNLGSLPGATASTPPKKVDLEQAIVSEANKFMVSLPENPFVYPLNGIYTPSNDAVLGLSSIVTPLSQGQFGVFDLMIFTEQGNYAATVTDEGTYSTIKPMQRNVCINPSAIVPTDYTILYASAKGLMSANGNTIETLSEALDGTFQDISLPVWSEFIRDCMIAYDYAGQRIILTSTSIPYAFVRSNEGWWTMAKWGVIDAVLNIYPYAYLQKGNSLVCLDKPFDYHTAPTEGRIVTRPLKLGSLQMKSIHQLSVEGLLGDIQNLVLYASHDAVSWVEVGSTSASHIRRMAGRPFKYWKIEIDATLNGSQNITGVRLQVHHRKEQRYR